MVNNGSTAFQIMKERETVYLNPEWTISSFLTRRSFDKHVPGVIELIGPLGPLDTEQTFGQQGVQNFSIIYCEPRGLLEGSEGQKKMELTPDEKWLVQEVDRANHIARPPQKALLQEAEAKLNGAERRSPHSRTEEQTCRSDSAVHSRAAVHCTQQRRDSGCDSPPSSDGGLSRSDDDPFRD